MNQKSVLNGLRDLLVDPAVFQCCLLCRTCLREEENKQGMCCRSAVFWYQPMNIIIFWNQEDTNSNGIFTLSEASSYLTLNNICITIILLWELANSVTLSLTMNLQKIAYNWFFSSLDPTYCSSLSAPCVAAWNEGSSSIKSVLYWKKSSHTFCNLTHNVGFSFTFFSSS